MFPWLPLAIILSAGAGYAGAKEQRKSAETQARQIRKAAKPTPQQQALRRRLQAYYEAMLSTPSFEDVFKQTQQPAQRSRNYNEPTNPSAYLEEYMRRMRGGY